MSVSRGWLAQRVGGVNTTGLCLTSEGTFHFLWVTGMDQSVEKIQHPGNNSSSTGPKKKKSQSSEKGNRRCADIIQSTLGVFGPNSSRNYLRGTVHWGVPGELNTFKSFFFLLAFALPKGTPYVSYLGSWPAVGTLTSLPRDLQHNLTTTTTNES